MQKEILTTQTIVREERMKFKDTAKTAIISFIILALLLVFVLWMFKVVLGKISLLIVVLLAPCIFMMIVLLCMFFESYIEYRHLKDGYFRVTMDTLVNYEDKQPDFFSVSKGITPTPYVFLFKTYGRYVVAPTKHYKESKTLEMSDDGVFNTAIIGDTFFLVLNEKEKILQVYNTKFFEYQN